MTEEINEPVIDDEPVDDTNEQIESEQSENEPLEEFEEIEFSGKKYNVPKELKDAFLMQSDYTRKTQDVAEQRKAIEAERELFKQQIEANQRQDKLAAKIAYLNEQISEYSQADWNGLTAHDPVKAQQLFMQFSQLKDAKNAAENEFRQNEQQFQYERQNALQQKLQTEQAILARDIPDWSPDKARQLSEFAIGTLGFDARDVAQITDARLVKMLNMAMVGHNMINKQTPKGRSVDIKATSTVNTKSAGGRSNDPSKMTDSEFAAWRREQIKARYK